MDHEKLQGVSMYIHFLCDRECVNLLAALSVSHMMHLLRTFGRDELCLCSCHNRDETFHVLSLANGATPEVYSMKPATFSNHAAC